MDSTSTKGLPPKLWIWDELKQFGAVNSNKTWFTDLQGEIHPLFFKQQWVGVSSERHDALQQSFILSTKLLKVGSQYLCNFLPADRMKQQITTFMSLARNYRLPIHLGWTSDDIEEAFGELNSIAEYVQWEENSDIWPASQWTGMNRPATPRKAVETRSTSPFNNKFEAASEEAWMRASIRAKGAHQPHRHITITVASQYVDAILKSEKDSERHMVAVFAAAINMVHELGNTIIQHRTDWDQKPLWIGKDVVADPGESMLAWLFDGWFPEVNVVSKEKPGLDLDTGMHWRKMFRKPVIKPRALVYYSIPLEHIQRITSEKEWKKFPNLSEDYVRIRYDLLRPATPFRAGEHARRGDLLSENAWSDEEIYRDFVPGRDLRTRDYVDDDWDDQPSSLSRKRQGDNIEGKGASSSGRDAKRREQSGNMIIEPDIDNPPGWFQKGIYLPDQGDTVQDYILEQNRSLAQGNHIQQYLAKKVAAFNMQLLPNAPPVEDKDYYDVHDQSENPVRRSHFLEYKKAKAETIDVMNKCLWDAFVDCRKFADEAADWRKKFEDLEQTKTKESLGSRKTGEPATDWQKKYEAAEAKSQEYQALLEEEKEDSRYWQQQHQESSRKLNDRRAKKDSKQLALDVSKWRQRCEELEIQSAQDEVTAQRNIQEIKARQEEIKSTTEKESRAQERSMASLQRKYDELKTKSLLEISSAQGSLDTALKARADLQEIYDVVAASLAVFASQASDGPGDVAFWQQQFADGFLKWAEAQAKIQQKELQLEEKVKRELSQQNPDMQEQHWQEDVNRQYPLQTSGDIEDSLRRRLAKVQAKKALLKQLDVKLRKHWGEHV